MVYGPTPAWAEAYQLPSSNRSRPRAAPAAARSSCAAGFGIFSAGADLDIFDSAWSRAVAIQAVKTAA